MLPCDGLMWGLTELKSRDAEKLEDNTPKLTQVVILIY